MEPRDKGITLPGALERLGLDRRATPADVRKAYRRLSLANHPDRIQDPGEKLAAQRRFMRIRDAYEFLHRHPHLLGGFQPGTPVARHAEPAPDSAEARVERIIRRYRELHAVRPSPAAEYLSGVLEGDLPTIFVWGCYVFLVAALLTWRLFWR
jgi:hypothetical protein